jgi:hypothetical protein
VKDVILNTGLSAFAFAAILFVAFDNHGVTPESSWSRDTAIFTIDKTVVTASRLP